MDAFARWSVRHRSWVIGGWLALVVVLAGLSQWAGGATYQNDFTFPDSDSQAAQAIAQRDFPAASGDVDQIVFHTTAGTVTDPAVRDRMGPALAKVAALPHVVQVASPYTPHSRAISRDATTAFATVTFDAPASDLPPAAITGVIDTARAARTATLRVELGGQAIEQVESAGPGPLTIVGLAAAVVVLLVLFGSVTAMLLPIVTVLVAIGAGTSVNGLVTHVMDVGTATEAIALMIALGVGIDYSLFIVARFRALLAEGRDPEQAAAGSVNTSGRAVLFAGTIVVLALLVLLLFGISITNGIAVGAAVDVFCTMAAALTLLPAVLSLLGRRVNSLRVPSRHPAGSATISPRLAAWAGLVRRRRWVAAPVVFVVMLVLALPILGLRLGSPDAGSDPAGTTTRRAYELVADSFGPGFNGPLEVVATPSDAAVVARLATTIAADPGVASVSPPRVSPAGTAAVVQVVPTTSPQAAATADLVHRLRATIIPRATAGSAVTVHVGGPTAAFIDLSSLLGSRLLPFIAVVLAIGFVLLLVLFRSLVIPLTAAVLNLLSIGAALGVVVAVFQQGWTGLPSGPVVFALPVMMFAIVFGLSTDYQVFLLTRIQEEWLTHHDNDRAVHDGMGRVSGVITGAAVIMIAVFSSFALGGQILLQQIGVGFAVAVALDAFLLRFILVPAVMYVLGRRNWHLPRWLAWLPRIHIEPQHDPLWTDDAQDTLAASGTRRSRPAAE
ncbi:MAG TPA: MMPL family transporter [Pseudonocardiaceae bacterium]|nr:MMPL family transporter [Pseudonocardiaceae bacterium]